MLFHVSCVLLNCSTYLYLNRRLFRIITEFDLYCFQVPFVFEDGTLVSIIIYIWKKTDPKQMESMNEINACKLKFIIIKYCFV